MTVPTEWILTVLIALAAVISTLAAIIVFDGTEFVHVAPPEPLILDPEPSTL
jgi:hypothetical protein